MAAWNAVDDKNIIIPMEVYTLSCGEKLYNNIIMISILIFISGHLLQNHVSKGKIINNLDHNHYYHEMHTSHSACPYCPIMIMASLNFSRPIYS